MAENTVYGIEENKDGQITDLFLSPMDASIKEKVAYEGACTNIGAGEEYCIYDNKGVKHKLKVDDKGEIVTDEDKKLKSVFSKELTEKEAAKLAEPEEKTTKVSKSTK